jgi:Cytochrome P460
MKRLSVSILVLAVAAVAGLIASRPFAAIGAKGGGSPIYGVTIPAGYRQWEVVAPSQEAGSLDELRVILGNAISMEAYREGRLPFPDGAMLAKVAWKRVPSARDDGALGSPEAFVPGAATTVQIMVKDSKRFAASGGWGFGRFIDGKPVDEAQHETCFPCHDASAKGHDLLFTQYAH